MSISFSFSVSDMHQCGRQRSFLRVQDTVKEVRGQPRMRDDFFSSCFCFPFPSSFSRCISKITYTHVPTYARYTGGKVDVWDSPDKRRSTERTQFVSQHKCTMYIAVCSHLQFHSIMSLPTINLIHEKRPQHSRSQESNNLFIDHRRIHTHT